MQNIATGDERAFNELVRCYHAKVFYHALTFTKSYAEAEEITQDIFLKIWELREKLPPIDRFKDYLYILGRNQIISSMRKRAARTETPQEFQLDVSLSPDKQYELKEINTLILNGIDHLTPQQKAVFKMSRLEHLSHEQIAERLNISRHAVNWHMVKALNFLRQYLAQAGERIICLVLGWWTLK